MVLANNILSIITLIMDMLKTIHIFPGFSMYTALVFMIWVTVIVWLLGALFGLFNFKGGGGSDD